MYFYDVLPKMMNNCKRARRRYWRSINQHVEIVAHVSFRYPDGVIYNEKCETRGRPQFVLVGETGVYVGWMPSQSDIFACDWEIMDE